jgi:tripartite-type tricarboxylate transporter receptor subunit TctC
VSNYTANNTYKDWYKKLEKLIKDEKFRKKLAKKQWDIVRNNADLTKVVKNWEKVFTK